MIRGLSKINRYLLAGAGAIGILAAGGTPVRAADVQQLEAAMKAMQAQMESLQRQVQEAKAAASAAQSAAKDSDLDLKIKWKGAPELSSSDGKFKFKVRGRLSGSCSRFGLLDLLLQEDNRSLKLFQSCCLRH